MVLLAVSLGLFLLIIPGIYLMVALGFSWALYIEYHHEGLGIFEAMSVSRKMVTRHWCTFFGLSILCFFVYILGLMFFIVGILVAIPVVQLTLTFAFRDMFGFSETKVPHHQSCVFC